MDIIKSILHVFKKNDNAFKVMHPETESACITDWNNGIVNTLASTGLSSLVNVLSSDSLLALLIKKVFDATGVKYSLGQNGYVCFGSLVGGFIIQWGFIHSTGSIHDYTLPLSMSVTLAAVANDAGGNCNSIGITLHASTVTIISRQTNDLSYASTYLYYIVVGA